MKNHIFPMNPTARILRQFAGAWLAFFLLLSADEIWRRGNLPAGLVLAAVALAGIAGLIRPKTMRLLFIAASTIAFPIGWVVSQVMLALIFFCVVTPMAFFWRARGRDVLQLKKKAEQSTFWISREPPPEPERYLKQF